jgi:hypothetical protein
MILEVDAGQVDVAWVAQVSENPPLAGRAKAFTAGAASWRDQRAIRPALQCTVCRFYSVQNQHGVCIPACPTS